MMNYDIAGDTQPVGCAFDDSIVHHKVFLLKTISKFMFDMIICSQSTEKISLILLCCSISRTIQITTILLTTLNLESTRKDVD
jgi:hypothetical protein